jgi:hypothetical protein
MTVRRVALMAALLSCGCAEKKAAVTDTATSATEATQDPTDSVIGRDSAFGPIGTMDSDGTVRPIRK